MKKLLLFLLLPCFVQAQTYTLTRNLSNNLISGSGTSVALTDDSFAGALPIGFSFNFYGNNYTNFFLCSNGFISFGAGSTNIYNIIPSTEAPNNIIAFANTDLNPGIGSPTINYFTTGSNPNRVLVINFNNVRHFSNMSLTTVQVQLFETSNKIEIHSTNNVSGGDVRTIAVENIDGTQGVTEPSLNNTTSFNVVNEMIRFTPSIGGCTPPVITSNAPFLCEGHNVTFTATGIPANTPMQWQRNGIDIQGATTTTYTPPSGMPGNYRVVTASCASNVITINPNQFILPDNFNPNLCEGQSVTFTIANFHYFIENNINPIWMRNGQQIPNAFGPSYTTSQAGQYSIMSFASGGGLPNTCPSNMLEITPKPATPTASVTVQPSCMTPTGTIVVTAPTGANLQYSVNGSNYQTNPTFAGLTPGNYSVTAKNTVSNCTSNALNLTVNALPTAPATPTASVTVQPSCSVSTGTIVVTAPTGANLQYNLNGGTYQTSTTFSELLPNTYLIRVRNTTTGCVSNPLTLTVNTPSATPVITANAMQLCEGQNVTFTATGIPANTPLQWQRNGIDIQAATTTTYTPPAGMPGNYRVVTASCTSNVITINPNQFIFTNNPNLCEGQNITFSIVNFHYFIENNINPIWMRNGQPIPDAVGPNYTTSQVGMYSIMSVPLNGGLPNSCPSNMLEITPKPATPTASVTVQPSCTTPTGTIVVTAPTGANLQYSVNGSTYQSSPTFAGLAPGNYSVTVKNTVSNCTSNALNLTVNAVPTAPATPTASVTVQPSCSVSTGTIVVTAPTGANLQYNLNGGSYQTSTTFSGLLPNTYLIRVRNTATGCVSNPLTLTVNTPSATPVITANAMQLCEGQNVTFTATDIPANTPMQWQRNGIDIQAATTTTYTPPAGMPGNYRVVTASCTSNVITINPNQFIFTNNPNLCEGQNITFSIVNFHYFIENNINPIWMRNGQPIPDAVGPNYTTSQVGMYSIMSVPLNGGLPNNCPFNMLEITPKPATPTASVTVQPSCTTPTGTIVVTAPTGADLQYSVNGSTYQTNPTFAGLTPGNYSVAVKNTVSNCISNGLSLTVNAVPTVPATPTASVTVQPSCSVSTGTIVVTAPTGANLQYNLNGGSYQTSTTFSGLLPNTYLIRVRNTATGCVSNPLTLTVNTPAATPVITANAMQLCEGQNVTFTATGIPANTPMQWQRNGIDIQAATTTTYTPPAGMPGNYRVVTASCTSNVITINPNQFIFTNNPNLCEGQNITFSIVNFHYFIENNINPIWMRNGQPIPDAVGPNYTTSQVGMYSIMSVPLNGGLPNNCPFNMLEITPKPATPTASVTVQPSCTTPTGTIVVTAPTGADLQYSVNGSTYQANPTFAGLAPGNYSVAVKNTVSNCTSNALNLTVNAVPTAPATPTASVTVQPSCSVSTGTIVVTAPTGANLQYNLNGGSYQTNTTFSGLAAGTYLVRVRNTTTGCVSNALTLIVNTPSASPVITANTTNLCEGQNVTFTATGIPANTPMQWQRNGIDIQAATTTTYTPPAGMPGNYRVVTASCTSNVITINPNQFIFTNNPNLCEGQNITFSIVNFHYFIENNINPIWMRNGQPIPDAVGPNYTTSQVGMYSIMSVPLNGGLPNNCPFNMLEITPKPATPTASVTVQPSCTTPTGTIVVTAPTGADLQYSVNGSTYQANPTFAGLAPGNYSVAVKNTVSNCTSNALNLTVNAVLETCGTLTITPAKVFVCPNTPTTLVASGCAGTVTWTGGITGNSLTVSASTTTTYTATCAGGESSSITVNVASTTANLTVLDNINTGTQLFQTTQSINAANTIGSNIINPKPTVTYQAGQSILLQPGFTTVNGSVFKAEIKGCSN